MIPTQSPPDSRGGAWRLNVVLLILLLLGVATRFVSPAVFLDIGSLWPVAVVLMAAGWVVKTVWYGRRLAEAPLYSLLAFSWILVSAAFYFADLPGLPSSSADLRGPPAHQSGFDTFSVELGEGRLVLSAGTGPAAYGVDMIRGGGGAGVPVAVESRGGAQGRGEVNVIDARQPLPGDLNVTVEDNPWLRFAGWEVTLHPQTNWRIVLSGSQISADLRNLSVAALALNGQGNIYLGEAAGTVSVAVNGTFTVEVPPQASVTVMGDAIVPEDWTVADDTAWFGEPETGWQIDVTEGGSVQVLTAEG